MISAPSRNTRSTAEQAANLEHRRRAVGARAIELDGIGFVEFEALLALLESLFDLLAVGGRVGRPAHLARARVDVRGEWTSKPSFWFHLLLLGMTQVLLEKPRHSAGQPQRNKKSTKAQKHLAQERPILNENDNGGGYNARTAACEQV
jgi:hypothetical protein